MKKSIYIYQDEGVSDESLSQTLATMTDFLSPKYTVKAIDATDVMAGTWMDDAALFIMPGGSDLPYVRKLNGIGNTRIKEYVRKGGSFLGVCAGAYYAAAYVEFDKSGGQEVLGDRELAFFPGKAIGPVLAKYYPKSNRGALASRLLLALTHLQESTVYYNGGGYFEAADEYPEITVLGEYENHCPAIVHIPYGKGQVVLSGAHIEYDPAFLNPKDPHLKPIISLLKAHETSRKQLLIEIFKRLQIEF